jgi:hypothetical protein
MRLRASKAKILSGILSEHSIHQVHPQMQKLIPALETTKMPMALQLPRLLLAVAENKHNIPF